MAESPCGTHRDQWTFSGLLIKTTVDRRGTMAMVAKHNTGKKEYVCVCARNRKYMHCSYWQEHTCVSVCVLSALKQNVCVITHKAMHMFGNKRCPFTTTSPLTGDNPFTYSAALNTSQIISLPRSELDNGACVDGAASL